MSPIGISVVIPLYNKAGTLARAIDSVLTQNYAPLELVVVDDGSSDDSADIAAAYGARLTLLRQENTGPSAARNRGARASRHSLLHFLDADDELLPGALAAHAHCRTLRPEVTLSLGSFRKQVDRQSAQDEILSQRGVDLDRVDNIHFQSGFNAGYMLDVMSGAICVNRDLFAAVDGFDEQLRCWEITDFLLRAQLRRPLVGIIDTLTATVHPDTENSQFDRMRDQATYLSRYAHKLLDHLDEIPGDQHERLLRPVRHFLFILWSSGALREFKRLAVRACPRLPTGNRPTKLCAYSKLPLPVLRLLHTLRVARPS